MITNNAKNKSENIREIEMESRDKDTEDLERQEYESDQSSRVTRVRE